MPALRIFARARASRWAIVGTGTRNARATSGVDKPPSACNVNATCASSASEGWQQVNISFRRSSGIDSISLSSSSSSTNVSRMAALRSSVESRRKRSMARRRATVVSQAPGLRGMPSISQRSSASTSASCSASSASVKSPHRLISAARTRPCSSRKVVSIRAAAIIQTLPLLFLRESHHRADLNRAELGAGILRCPANRFIEVFAVEQKISA